MLYKGENYIILWFKEHIRNVHRLLWSMPGTFYEIDSTPSAGSYRQQQQWVAWNKTMWISSSSSSSSSSFSREDRLPVWWSGVVVSTLALINEVNLRRTRLVLRWVTVSGSIPGAEHLFQYVTNQPPKANSALHPSGVGKWVSASAGKAKAGMVHSVSGWTRGVQVKLWDPLRTRAIPERLRGAFTTRRYTNPRLPYLT